MKTYYSSNEIDSFISDCTEEIEKELNYVRLRSNWFKTKKAIRKVLDANFFQLSLAIFLVFMAFEIALFVIATQKVPELFLVMKITVIVYSICLLKNLFDVVILVISFNRPLVIKQDIKFKDDKQLFNYCISIFIYGVIEFSCEIELYTPEQVHLVAENLEKVVDLFRNRINLGIYSNLEAKKKIQGAIIKVKPQIKI